MATFYVGSRNVLKGRNSNDSIHTWKASAGTYSNWSLMNSSHVLDGAPDADHTPGTGYHPHGWNLTYFHRGLGAHKYPLSGAGDGPRVQGDFRWRPLEYKGLVGAKALAGTDFGHAERTTDYSVYNNYAFDGVTSAEAMKSSTVGHAVRYTSTINSFGSFGPYVHKGVTTAMSGTVGQALPDDNQGEYGHNRVLEWTGVPSTKAL